METKANHLAVGVFVLVALAGFFAFVMWLGKTEIDREVDAYHIYFRGSVSGLTSSSTVRYRGVPVGSVTDIVIDPNNSEQVLVTIEVTGGTPIKEDATASLEMQGITGLVNVQISGGAKESPRLVAEQGQPLPVVASVPSALEALFENIPRAIVRFTDLVERATLLLSDENMEAITDTLQSVRRLGNTMAESSDDVEALTADVAATAAEIRRAAEEMNLLVADIRERVPALLDATTSTLSAAEGAFDSVSANVDTLTGEAQTTLGQLRANADTLTRETQQTMGQVRESAETLTAETTATLREMRESTDQLASEAQPTLRQFRESAETLTSEAELTMRQLRESAEALTAEAVPTLRQVRESAETLTAEAGPTLRQFRESAVTLTDESQLTLRQIRETTDAVGTEAELALREARESVGALTGDARIAMQDIRKTAKTLADTAEDLQLIVAENREAFRDFSNEGLYEMSRFLVEARELVAGLTIIVDRFEADPARFLFGDSQAGYEPQ